MRPGQVSELLQIPSSTLRFYSVKFGDFLSPSARKGKRRDYSDRDISTLGMIRTLTGQGLTADQVKTQLTQTIDQDPEVTALTIPAMIARYDDVDRQITDLKEQVHQLRSWASLPWWKRLFVKPPW